MRNVRFIIFCLIGSFLIGLSIWLFFRYLSPVTHFNGERAYKDVLVQVNFGPRIPGSTAHTQTIVYIQQELERAGWRMYIQDTLWQGFSVQNIIASRSGTAVPIIVGAHYDSRLLADQDQGPDGKYPVPGADDGASGVAVLLELARTLPAGGVPVQLVFFDAEDNGGLESRQWIMGSRAFVAALKEKPRAAIIVDMVGDSDLNIYIERNSNLNLTSAIWRQAAVLGYGKDFIAQPKYDMIDDHTPFLEDGIPAVDIIDFDYPYWHTAADTADKVSAKSLQAVGETLWAWLVRQK
jgi:Zn-dependent M28 family amino/carboxypeptidase